jgi:putative DNA primase/helicase
MSSAAWTRWPRHPAWSSAKATPPPAACRKRSALRPVAAFDSGNLVPVAKALHEKYPDKPMVIAGDDDKHLEATQGVNPGRSKAEEAARAVGGKLLLPIFAPGEQAANPKGFTDFNDLATRSVLGQEGIARQVRSVVDDVLERQQGRSVEGLPRGERQEQAVASGGEGRMIVAAVVLE